MLRCSDPNDLPRLKVLWHDCFGDPEGYINLYLTFYWKPERMFVLEADGAVRAKCSWFEMTLGGQPAAYFYAVATDPAYQGRGFCRKLMAYAEAELSKQGITQFLLVPGEKSLFRFYQTMGYETVGAIGSADVKTSLPGSVTPIEPVQYALLRQKAAPVHAVQHPLEQIRYQATLCLDTKGGLFALGDTGCAVVERISETTLLAKEVLGFDPLLAGSHLLHHCGGEHIIVRFPDDTGTPFCMGKNLAVKPCYLGLAFD